MPQGKDDYLRGIHTIDDTVGCVENFPERGQADLWDDATAARESIQLGNPLNQLFEPLLGACGSIECDGVNGFERSLLSKHRPSDLHRSRRVRSVFATAA